MDSEAKLERRLKEFGKKIREFREASGLLQDEVYARGGPSDKVQSRVENGAPPAPSITTLKKYEVGLGLRPGSAAESLFQGGALVSDDGAAHPESEADIRLRIALEKALERAGVTGVAARKHGNRGGRGYELSARDAAKLVKLLNSLPKSNKRIP